MRSAFAAVFAGLACISAADRIILVPLDSRPAAGQFSQMIGRMANVYVQVPPPQILGRFTSPGKPEAIFDWLEKQKLDDVIAVVVSTDMIAYGGLIASRSPEVSQEQAMQRFARLAQFKAKLKNRPLFGFSGIMRLYPTSTRASAPWRLQLGRMEELIDLYRRTKAADLPGRIASLRAQVPPLEVERYRAARLRNHAVQRSLLKLTSAGLFDYLILGQDDAQPYGPHIPETQSLKALAESLAIGGKVYFCEGVDQLSNILVSRALLKRHGWTPRVRIVYSDEAARKRIANYESKNIEQSLRDQLLASGARPWISGDYDYTLWLNAPEPNPEKFEIFLESLASEVDQGFPAGVADINLGKTGTGDPRLFDDLWQNDRMIRLLSYAGWNTAGNTMGTSIPAANVYLLSRRIEADPLKRELAQREFVLHRFVNDFAFHRYTRPEAYRLIDSLNGASREETYGPSFAAVNDFVRQDMEKHLQAFFAQQFMGKRFFAGTKEYVLTGIDSVKIQLPWPRAYEVRLEFRLQVATADSAGPHNSKLP